jgi:hypothetical protein
MIEIQESYSGATDSTTTEIIYKFCETFGEGYEERKNMFDEIYQIEEEEYFSSNCTEYYDYVYDSEAARFDPIDLTGYTESSVLCSGLYDLIYTLREHGRDTLSEVIRYSYLYSIEYFIESAEVKDYSDCEEREAEDESTFCLWYFNWASDFPLWSSTEIKLVCGEVYVTLADTTTSDYCAFIVTEVY